MKDVHIYIYIYGVQDMVVNLISNFSLKCLEKYRYEG